MRGLAHAQAQAENWLRFLVRLPAAARFPSLSLSRGQQTQAWTPLCADLCCMLCGAAQCNALHAQIHWLTLGKLATQTGGRERERERGAGTQQSTGSTHAL